MNGLTEDTKARLMAAMWTGLFVGFALDRLLPGMGSFDWPIGLFDCALVALFAWKTLR